MSADDFLDDPINDEDDLLGKIERVHRAFEIARNIARVKNTEIYLSMVSDLDAITGNINAGAQDFIKWLVIKFFPMIR